MADSRSSWSARYQYTCALCRETFGKERPPGGYITLFWKVDGEKRRQQHTYCPGCFPTAQQSVAK